MHKLLLSLATGLGLIIGASLLLFRFSRLGATSVAVLVALFPCWAPSARIASQLAPTGITGCQ